MNISYSRMSTYLRCPYAHYLGYEVGIRPKAIVRPLKFGTDFHKLLELRKDPKEVRKAWKTIKETYYDLPAKFQSELGENYPNDLKQIFQDYQKVYAEAKMPTITEKPFEIPISGIDGEPIIFKGVIDELYIDPEMKDCIDLGEHKTFSKKPDLNTLTMNTQKNLYAKACLILYGTLPKRVIWDYIHSIPAEEPIWLDKSNRFSTAKSDKITEFSYKRACKRKGIEPDQKALEKYHYNTPNFFFHVEQDIIPSMVDNVWEGFVYTANDIVRQGYKNKTKNMTRDCSWCSYRDICFAELTQGNIPELIKAQYELNPREDIINKERRVLDVRFS